MGKSKNKNYFNTQFIVDIDYDKLAYAFIKAQEDAEKKEKEKMIEYNKEVVEFFKLKDYSSIKCFLYRFIIKILDAIYISYRMNTCSKKFFNSENFSISLLKMCSCFLIWIVKIILLLFSAFSTYYFISSMANKSFIDAALYFTVALFGFLLRGLFRLVGFEIENSLDKNFVINITTVILAIVAIFISILSICEVKL